MNLGKLFSAIIGAGALFGGTVAAQEDVPIGGPVDAFAAEVTRVTKLSPGYRAAAARFEAVEMSVRRARAAGLPEISIAANASTGFTDTDFGEGGNALLAQLASDLGPMNTADLVAVTPRAVQLSVSQPLFTGFRIRNGIAEAKATVRAAEADFAATRQGLTVSVAEAVLGIETAEARVAVAEKSIELIGQQRRAAQVAFEAGQGTRTDIALADARLAAADAQLSASQAALIAARSQLRLFTGEETFSAPTGGPLPVPPSVEEALAQGQRHPRILAATALSEAQDAVVRQEKGRRSPQLRLRATAAYAENQTFEGDTTESANLIAELSVPLYQGGDIGAGIAQAKANARASRFDRTAVQREIETTIRGAFAQYKAAEVAARAALAQEDAAELAYRGVLLEREVGQRSILDVLQVEEDLQDARLSVVDGEAGLVLASYRLLQSIGTL